MRIARPKPLAQTERAKAKRLSRVVAAARAYEKAVNGRRQVQRGYGRELADWQLLGGGYTGNEQELNPAKQELGGALAAYHRGLEQPKEVPVKVDGVLYWVSNEYNWGFVVDRLDPNAIPELAVDG